MTTIAADPARIDIEIRPGEPVDFTVPVLDGDGVAQSLSGWTLAGEIRDGASDRVLFTPALTGDGDGVRVAVAAGDTADWSDWPVTSARWDLWLTPPAGEPLLLVAGWVRVHS